MARVVSLAEGIGGDESAARALLVAAGVRLHRVPAGSDDADPADVRAVLAEGERDVRAVADIEVPADVDAGMGAWHVNAADEMHVVLSGEGIMEFATMEGSVAVLVSAGDVVEIRGAEHRYRPLTAQRWVLRYSGPAGADLAPTPTGRSTEPWPVP